MFFENNKFRFSTPLHPTSKRLLLNAPFGRANTGVYFYRRRRLRPDSRLAVDKQKSFHHSKSCESPSSDRVPVIILSSAAQSSSKDGQKRGEGDDHAGQVEAIADRRTGEEASAVSGVRMRRSEGVRKMAAGDHSRDLTKGHPGSECRSRRVQIARSERRDQQAAARETALGVQVRRAGRHQLPEAIRSEV